MHTRRKKTACMVMVILIMLSGIYLDTVTTDTFFVYNSMRESISSAQSDARDFIFGKVCFKDDFRQLDRYVCTTKMLNEFAGIELQFDGWNLFFCLLYIGYIFLLQGKGFWLFERIQTFYWTLDALVAEYIHQSDGKKRI